MKILRIGGKNLASLAGEFAVDFQHEPLLSSGLFAISGPTGAGKSTLLDALCLALYDATPRLLRAGSKGIGLPDVRDETVTPQDTRTLLRRGAADGYAEVDFVGSDGHAYRARWSVRRARSKADGALQAVSMSLKQLPDEQPIGGTNREVKAEIERRIGLSFEQFTRAVLLAQNEFSAFLKADDGERGELLETLTGTAIYSDISRRAYERMKAEQTALQQLNLRLADHQPLAQEARAQLESDCAQAKQSLAALEQHKASLETHLRWHQTNDLLLQGERQAQRQLDAREADHAAAAARRVHLGRIESVQAARPLLVECERADSELARSRQKAAEADTGNTAAGTALRDADQTLEQAMRALAHAEASQAAAAPQLDHAKALDVQLDTLQPSAAQALAAVKEARAVERTTQSALAEHNAQALRARRDLQESTAWLDAHRSLQPLAEAWPRWHTLLTQADRDLQELAAAERMRAQAEQAESQAGAAASDSAQKLLAAESLLQEAERVRQVALERFATIDMDGIARRRQLAEARHELLTQAEQRWQEMTDQRASHAEQSSRKRALNEAAAESDAVLARVGAQLPAAEAALTQAERSLKLSEAACGDSVESLRATLEDDVPCPVCGACEHPYTSADHRLRAMLAQLQDQVAQCRAQAQQLRQEQASHSALAAESRKQAQSVEAQLRRLTLSIEAAEQAWQAHPLATEMDVQAGADWFAGQRDGLRVTLRDIALEEEAVRSAMQERDAVQKKFDTASAHYRMLKDTTVAAQAALARASADLAAARARHADLSARLESGLSDLDAAFSNDDWRRAWHAAPTDFHAERRAEAEQWLARSTLCHEAQVRIGKLDVEIKAATEAANKAQAEAARAVQVLATIDAGIEEKKAARRALFDGRPVEQVQSELRHALETAKAGLAACLHAKQQCAAEAARAHEALQLAQQGVTAQTATASLASSALDAWITGFNRKCEENEEDRLDLVELRRLLAHAPEWIREERVQLQTVDSTRQQARAVLEERQAQRGMHESQRPTPDAADTIRTALADVAVQHQEAANRATALQLKLADDDARRARSAAMLTEIAHQESVARTWARLSDLIGSADGKKFRNYAQQFTLDVLLGYANRHLAELARRYRLERIKDSLALLVVDQDMGEELRSVHSLSGGESFLVSLSLALALASLSSNRVRVESLFIDEGFGSLDAETLAVAMDALDGLQAMGRKVGVISHVQEMTERIGTRIVVRRQAGGRSAVSVG